MGRDGSGVKAASDSSIEITFSYRGERCRERVPLQPTPANLKRAEKHKASIDVAIANGTFDYAATFPNSPRRFKFMPVGSAQTFQKFLEAWLANEKPMVKASTWDDYRKIVDNTYAAQPFASRPVSEVGRAEFRAMCSSMKAGNKRIANVLSVARLAFAQAVQDGTLQANPLTDWKFVKAEPPTDELDDAEDVFTADEQARVLAKLQPAYANYFTVALWAGLRPSEMVALEWRDIDLKAGHIRVVRARTDAAEEAEAPKTKGSRRTVKLLAPARQALERQRAITQMAGSQVWTINQVQAANEIWELACRKAGVRYRPSKQCRHTYASMMLTAGEPPMWVAKQMGHANWSMIQKVYGKFIPSAHPDAGGAAEKMFAAVPQLKEMS